MHNRRGKRGSGHTARRSFKPNPNRILSSGRDNRPSALRSGMPIKPIASSRSTTALVADAAIYFDGALVGESPEAHIVARKSVTESQYLGAVPQRAEYETLAGTQTDLVTGEVKDISRKRRVWQSDNTLLRRGNPFANTGNAGWFKREGAIRDGANTRKFRETVQGEGPNDKAMEDATQLPKVIAEDVEF